jgi:hypothetical protein
MELLQQNPGLLELLMKKLQDQEKFPGVQMGPPRSAVEL